jgi:glycerophosphoryl diester phosphodiesterase
MTKAIAIAHRGDPIGERENTLAAFLSAVRAGADMVELDLRRTRDGRIVVLHDATLTRLWGLDRPVSGLDLAEVVAIGSGTLRVPTLDEVVRAVEVPLMVDFTEGDVVEGAVQVIRSADAMRRSLFVTGNVEALRALRRSAPEARIGLTWTNEGPAPIELLESLGAEYWNPTFGLVSSEAVLAVHEAGFRVSTWTVDDPADMAKVIDTGVDAVVTNQIARLRAILPRG